MTWTTRVLTGAVVLIAVVGLIWTWLVQTSRVCSYDGLRWGGRFPARDGCNECSCDRGGVICTAMHCAAEADTIPLPQPPDGGH